MTVRLPLEPPSDPTHRLPAGDFIAAMTAEHGRPCWELKQCGRYIGGPKAEELGVCIAYPYFGWSCWAVAGTLCGGLVQGSAAQKEGNCQMCQHYLQLMQDDPAKLRADSRYFSEVMQAVVTGIFTINAKGIIDIRASATAQTYFGNDMAGKRLSDIVLNDDEAKQRFSKWIASAFARYGDSDWADIARDCPVGEVNVNNRWYGLSFSPFAREGQLFRVLVQVSDITRRKKLESDLHAILDNVVFGFLVIDRSLVVQDGFTQSCRELLETDEIAGRNLCDLLRLQTDLERAELRNGVVQVFDDILPEELAVDQLQQRFCLRNGKILRVEARAIRADDGQVGVLLMTVSDGTRLEEVQSENETNRTLLNILRQKMAFESFLGEAKEQIRDARAAVNAREETFVRRVAHTLKGNAACYGVTRISELIHRMEEQPEIGTAQLDIISAAFREFLDLHSDILGISFDRAGERIYVVGEAQLQRLRELQSSVAPESRHQYGEVLRDVALIPAERLLGPVDAMVQGLAARFGKQVEFQIEGAQLRVEPERLSVLFQGLSHILRNAVDHGVESAAERGAKAPCAQVKLSIRETQNHYHVAVADDGRGIDAERVAKAAVLRGLISQEQASNLSEGEKTALLFLDGVSTAAETTDVSGRGVGMSAVKSNVERLGGSIRIQSKAGLGTCFEMVVPKLLVHETVGATTYLRFSVVPAAV